VVSDEWSAGDSDPRGIGERIRTERKKQSLKLTQLAQRTGLSVVFLSQVELGENTADIETLQRITRVLGVRDVP